MVLIAQGMQEHKKFFYYFVEDLTFRQVAILLLMWSFFICCCKVCDFFKTQIGGWLKGSLKHNEPTPLRTQIEDLDFPQKTKYLILLP
jgi:hypothetical protein